MGLFLKFKSVSKSYEELVKRVVVSGHDVETEFGERTRELLNVMVEILNPDDESISDKYPLGRKAVDEYVEQLLNGSKNEFSYDYHSRLFSWKGVNQIDYVVKKLKENMNSRRALAITWQPDVDGIEKVDDDRASVPCLQYIQFLVRDGKLYQTVLFRSNDILLGYHSNAIGLIKLGKMVAEEVGVEYARYIHFIVSAHVYIDRDKSYINKYFPMLVKFI